MYVCPFDMAWCNRPECRTGACELTGESPFIPCVLCGVLVDTSNVSAVCRECLVVETVRDEA
jgi:hypothetical protein